MRRYSLGLVLLAGVSVAALAEAPLASAQSVSGASAGRAAGDATVAEIVVTAQKREENINKVGLSITALGATALKERNIQSVADIAHAVPGLSYTNSANNTPVYTLRGVGF